MPKNRNKCSTCALVILIAVFVSVDCYIVIIIVFHSVCAAQFFLRAVDAGCPRGYVSAALRYLDGVGTPHNEDQAMAFMQVR